MAYADTLALWKLKLPGYRHSEDISILPAQLFGSTAPVDALKNKEVVDERLTEAMAKLSGLPVTALVWSKVPEERRVLMGDVVLSEGQSIPSYVFDDQKYYIVQSIGQHSIKFKVQAESFADPLVFDVPFSFKTSLKNSSDFGKESVDSKGNATKKE